MTYSYAQKDNGRHLYGRRTAAAHTEARHGMDRRRGDTLVQQVGHQLAAIRMSIDKTHSSLHMYPDQDAPGESLFAQLKECFPQLTHHQLPAGCKDFSDFYVKNVKCKV